MKKNKIKNSFLEELRRIPIIQVACEKVGISRTSIYRWRETDETFLIEMDEALADGEALVNDMSESQVLTLIKEKNWSAISFWLRHRSPKFRDKVEITQIQKKEALSPEEEITVKKALDLANLNQKEKLPEDIKNQEQDDKQSE